MQTAGDAIPIEERSATEVTETRGYIEKGKVAYWQATLKIGFTLD